MENEEILGDQVHIYNPGYSGDKGDTAADWVLNGQSGLIREKRDACPKGPQGLPAVKKVVPK